MKLKTKALLYSLVLSSVAGYAESKLVINSADGQTISTQVQRITEITFSEAGMTIVSPDGNQTIPFADIIEMKFEDQNGADAATADLGGLTVKLNGGILTATGEGPVVIAAYNIGGQPVASASGTDEVSLDFTPLAKGVYIVRVNNKTIKLTR